MESLVNLESLKYAELQHLAKLFGIKANMKAEKLKAALRQCKATDCICGDAASEEGVISGLPEPPEPVSLQQPVSLQDPVVEQAPSGLQEGTRELSADFVTEPSANILDCADDQQNDIVTCTEAPADENKDDNIEVVETTDVLDPPQENNSEQHAVLNESSEMSFAECNECVSSPDLEVTIREPKRTTFNFNASDVKFDVVSCEKPVVSAASKATAKSSRDWAAIHQRQFDKMDSLDVFLKKRQQRRRILKTPPKRAAAFAASLKLPSQTNLPIPKPIVFAPSVLSTSRLNTNFTAMYKTPSAVAAKTPFKVEVSNRKSMTGVSSRKSMSGKENGLTPMDSTANKSLLSNAENKSLLSTSNLTAKKPVFDLKASLAKPITWTPHRGKLQPLSVGHVDVKAVKTKTREDRREEAKKFRTNQRQTALMQRRQQ